MGTCSSQLAGLAVSLRRELALRRAPTVRTSAGVIAGERQLGDAIYFGGVPFAASPEGPRRWLRPAPPEPWEGRLDCTSRRPADERRAWPVQAPGPWPKDAPPMSEDCLHLNVWVPAGALAVAGAAAARRGRSARQPLTAAAARAPVLVWIYGGGLQGGSKDSPDQEGRAYAERGIIFVSCNYRVGALGFVCPDGGDPHCGLWDQVAALRWVQREIGAFGGDEGRVTVMGESAGADSVYWLCCSPVANQLFQQAIIQSPSSFTTTPEQAAELAQEFGQVAGAASASLEDMQAMDVWQVLIAQLQGRFRLNPTTGPGWRLLCSAGGSLPDFEPAPAPSPAGLFQFTEGREPQGWIMPVAVLDGEFLAEQPLDALAHGAASHLRIIVGGNRDECSFSELPGSYGSKLHGGGLGEVVARLAWEFAGAPLLRSAPPGLLKGRAEQLLAEYQAELPDAVRGEAAREAQHILNTAISDFSFLAAVQLISARLARLGGSARVYRYQFEGYRGVGGFHAAEMPLVLGESKFRADVARTRVREQWLDSWAAFVQTGDPNTEAMAGSWRPYSDEDRPILLWDGELGWSSEGGAAVGRRPGLVATARLWEELWGVERAAG